MIELLSMASQSRRFGSPASCTSSFLTVARAYVEFAGMNRVVVSSACLERTIYFVLTDADKVDLPRFDFGLRPELTAMLLDRSPI